LFRQGDHRNAGHNSNKAVPVWNSYEDGFYSSETKQDRTGPSTDFSVSVERLQEQVPQARKTALRSSPGEYVFYTLKLN
jgi:hypothetical protein